MTDDTDTTVDAVQIALMGVDVLESEFGFTEEQAARWMDEFLTRLDSQNGKRLKPQNN